MFSRLISNRHLLKVATHFEGQLFGSHLSFLRFFWFLVFGMTSQYYEFCSKIRSTTVWSTLEFILIVLILIDYGRLHNYFETWLQKIPNNHAYNNASPRHHQSLGPDAVKWDKNVWEIHKTHKNECCDLNIECYYIVDTQFLYPDINYIILHII